MAGVAVVRISGPESDNILRALGVGDLPAPRYAALRSLQHPDSGELVDRALLLRFPGPQSFTGENVVELHVHGGEAVLSAVFDAIASSGLARMAEPGEFTRRAFENGKLDLTQAEALADLIAARTYAQRSQALLQYDGGLGALYDRWRAELVGFMAHAEAEIDFSDEELPDGLYERVVININELKQQIIDHSHTALQGMVIRTGAPVAILGAPNVGKSSLLNALARRDVAIVSSEAGTTRDVVEVQMNLGGYPVTIQDTAGLRQASDTAEIEGVRRARARAESALVKLVVLDPTEPDVPDNVSAVIDASTFVVASKLDIIGSRFSEIGGIPVHYHVSSVTGAGLDELEADLADRIAKCLSGVEGVVPTRERHRSALAEVIVALERFEQAELPELAAEDLRVAVHALGRITGRVDVDEMLDAVFRDFCIGK